MTGEADRSRRRGPPTLRTARLVLRPLAPADTARVAALAGDPAVAHHLDRMPSPLPLPLAARWIARRNLRWQERRGVTLAITRRGAIDLLGAVSLRVSAAHRHGELGYWVGADAWGDGVATEAAAALVEWGFSTLGLHRIHLRVLADNPASRRVAEKLGFAVEGVRRAHYRRGDAFVDVVELGLLCTDPRRARITAASRAPRSTAGRRRPPRRPRRS